MDPSTRASAAAPPAGFPAPYRWRGAAWGWLVLTLASGVLLRWGWTARGAGVVPFDLRHLLHAHSHVALLGWAFVGILALLLVPPPGAGGDEPDGWPRRTAGGTLFGEGAFHLLVGALFVAFLLQGYGSWSILLSMLHIGASFGILALWFRRVRPTEATGVRRPLDLALGFFVLATLGPWMLSLGGRMGEGWVEGWVGFYLALLFHGWLVLSVLALVVRGGFARVPAPAWTLMALGALPSVLPRMGGIVEGPGPAWIGWGGSAVLGAGLVMAGVGVARGVRGLGAPRGILLGSVALGAILAGVFLAVGTFPPLAPAVLAKRNLVVGYVHLLLLAFGSSGLVLLHFAGESPRGLRTLGILLFAGGSWTMVGILLGVGGASLVGRFAFWPVQEALTAAGAAALVGAFLLLPRRM